MAILLFPGQGSQYVGMGKEKYESKPESKIWFEKANEILGFKLSEVMFNGTEEELRQTSITQPAIFLNSYICFKLDNSDRKIDGVAGHSLGEFTALVASEALSFEDGLKLVSLRAQAMQKACDATVGSMAAILGLEDEAVEKLCADEPEVLVAANYNCPGQLVISGSKEGIMNSLIKAKEIGAKRAIELNVNGAFHSPLMEMAKTELETAINSIVFKEPIAPIYQNVNGLAVTDPEVIKTNLIAQLTSSVKWTQTMKNMVAADQTEFVEYGAKVLSGFLRRIDRSLNVSQCL